MNIHVRNLSPTTSCDELAGFFEKYGAVSDVSVSTYTVQGIYRASGFVEMSSNVQGHAAIDGLQGQELGGNLLKIQGG